MVIDALNKLMNGDYNDWVSLLPSVLWAKRISTNITIDKISFELIYGLLGILPIETEIQTWNIILWEGVENCYDLYRLVQVG